MRPDRHLAIERIKGLRKPSGGLSICVRSTRRSQRANLKGAARERPPPDFTSDRLGGIGCSGSAISPDHQPPVGSPSDIPTCTAGRAAPAPLFLLYGYPTRE